MAALGAAVTGTDAELASRAALTAGTRFRSLENSKGFVLTTPSIEKLGGRYKSVHSYEVSKSL